MSEAAWDEFAAETRAVAVEAHRLAAEGGSPAEREAFAVRKDALLARMAEPGTVFKDVQVWCPNCHKPGHSMCARVS